MNLSEFHEGATAAARPSINEALTAMVKLYGYSADIWGDTTQFMTEYGIASKNLLTLSAENQQTADLTQGITQTIGGAAQLLALGVGFKKMYDANTQSKEFDTKIKAASSWKEKASPDMFAGNRGPRPVAELHRTPEADAKVQEMLNNKEDFSVEPNREEKSTLQSMKIEERAQLARKIEEQKKDFQKQSREVKEEANQLHYVYNGLGQSLSGIVSGGGAAGAAGYKAEAGKLNAEAKLVEAASGTANSANQKAGQQQGKTQSLTQAELDLLRDIANAQAQGAQAV